MMYNSAGNVVGHISSPVSSGGGGGGGAATPRNSGGIHYPLQLQPHQVYQPVMVPLPPPISRAFFSATGSGDDGADFPIRDDRFPEWGNQETRDFIEIRAQLEWDFSAGNMNDDLWETVARRMREKGYLRTPDQCKWKWRILKGEQVPNSEEGQQALFFGEMHAVSSARMQYALDSETALVRGKKRAKRASRDPEELSEDQKHIVSTLPKTKPQKSSENNGAHSTPSSSTNDSFISSIKEMMRSFIEQQQRIDSHWRKHMEKQAEQREAFEQEWRQKMEKLEKEKLMMEQTHSELEEQRRVRDEMRAEKRDALLTALLNKLIQDETCA